MHDLDDDWHDESGVALPAPPPPRERRRLRGAARVAMVAAVMAVAVGGIAVAMIQGGHLGTGAPAPATPSVNDALRRVSVDVNQNVLPPGRHDGLQTVLRIGPHTATLLFAEGAGLALKFASGATVNVVRDVPDNGDQWVVYAPKDQGRPEHLDLHLVRGAELPS